MSIVTVLRSTTLALIATAALAAAGCTSTRQAVGIGVDERNGVITDVEENRIAVRSIEEGGVQEVWLRRSVDTKLERGGQPIDWHELEEGQPVRVSFTPASGDEQLIELDVLEGTQGDRVKSEVERIGG